MCGVTAVYMAAHLTGCSEVKWRGMRGAMPAQAP